MCRSIKPLFNYDPPATEEDIHAAALQFVRKVSGYRQPSQANTAAFDRAVEDIAASVQHLLDALVTKTPPRNRERELAKARERRRLNN
jgi:hypothetical protein